ncbi:MULTISPECIES: lipase family protein [Cyanophyceae]|uniref:lipase family protein n=1 Tax=Cyanophyceae TaxID=3028117 RepID=UPI002330DBDE|nr:MULTISPECIES: lipase family protein [Cyanophyceae]MDB9356149.1 lipase family protein [Nodularia spumigena CS-587/03]MDB9321169.1 lipase family protein [Nodularia spumigena CS-591/07A]MDB9331732.1 lipase family protein [Nodularia spumigena CS-591/04]MDB9340968.1 lipase family protein [Nodularia spumigena CS-589/07]MDB9347030.1 lipase family protein [Nodularia spumigena CS-588/01]
MNKPIAAPDKSQLDPGNAYWMARCASEVYNYVSKDNQLPDEALILANLKAEDDGFISVVGADKNSAQAALIEHKDYLCFTFRGTNELVDWLDNLNTFSTKQLFGVFHKGFWDSVDDVWDTLWAAYEERQRVQERPILITGHSLGGAMATVAAARLAHMKIPFTSVYTFGQPRSMIRSTAKQLDSMCKGQFFRFENNNDIVTKIPSRLAGYSHVGTHLYISEEKKISLKPGLRYILMDYLDGFLSALSERGFDGIQDHDMNNYLSAIQSWSFETQDVKKLGLKAS